MLDKVFILLIRVYRITFAYRRPCCRFIPTCSSYAIEAIKRYGAMKGGVLSLKRIIKCHPGLKKYSNCGYDPVP